MKKILNLIWIVMAMVLLTGCNPFAERRYGEGDVVRVLINPSGEPSSQFFMNLHVFNDSDEARYLVIDGFEYLDGNEWIKIPPIGEEDWMFNRMHGGKALQPNGQDADSFGTIMHFNDWLNPNYPTTGEFRARIRVYDLDGNYQFTQASNTGTLEYFRFEE